MAVTVFHVPVLGSLPLLLLALGVFIACNLAIGFTLSGVATTQMQVQQLAQFILLPSLLLSGFLFRLKEWMRRFHGVTNDNLYRWADFLTRRADWGFRRGLIV